MNHSLFVCNARLFIQMFWGFYNLVSIHSALVKAMSLRDSNKLPSQYKSALTLPPHQMISNKAFCF